MIGEIGDNVRHLNSRTSVRMKWCGHQKPWFSKGQISELLYFFKAISTVNFNFSSIKYDWYRSDEPVSVLLASVLMLLLFTSSNMVPFHRKAQQEGHTGNPRMVQNSLLIIDKSGKGCDSYKEEQELCSLS